MSLASYTVRSVLSFAGIALALGCSESPTGVPYRGVAKDALAGPQACYLIDGYIYCTTADSISVPVRHTP
jgi:hypothetical protein